MERPTIDYCNLPYLPREGIQTEGNNAYVTRSLFLETAKTSHEEGALWCLSEHEIYAHGRWYPSAWMAYIYATDEYDALRKICGNVKQWELIKEFLAKYRVGMFEAWQLEQNFVQKSKIRETLIRGATSGMPGYTAAAKLVLAMLDGPAKRGRPKKVEEQKPADKDTDEDAARVLTFRQ